MDTYKSGDRIILHIDVNSAFLSWEATYRLQHGATLDLRDVPSVVGGTKKAATELFWLNLFLPKNTVSRQARFCGKPEANVPTL